MKEFGIGPVENHRGREGGAIVYPVYSRRSRGLSVGINLFPDRKVCSFDCPYCEVFPFQTGLRFSLPVMEEALRGALAEAAGRGIPVRDICFSGNGEPSISPDFRNALEAAGRIRDSAVPEAALAVITNGTGLLNDETFAFMREAASGSMKLDIWLKLDAGTPAWYKAMGRSAVPFDALTGRIRKFAGLAPVTLQTMICAVEGRAPPAEEETAWIRLAAELTGSGGPGLQSGVRAVQIYGKARPAPQDPLAEALPTAVLEERAAALRSVIGTAAPVEVFP
jgi:histidinol dehydrogenase